MTSPITWYRNFLIKEPTRDPFEGTQMLLGRDTFTADVDDASILAGLNEELRAGLRTVEERVITPL